MLEPGLLGRAGRGQRTARTRPRPRAAQGERQQGQSPLDGSFPTLGEMRVSTTVAQHIEHRLGNFGAIATTQLRVRPKEMPQHQISRPGESQNASERTDHG
jgi:hypothetical protein